MQAEAPEKNLRGFYHRKTDVGLLRSIGEYPLSSAREISADTARPYSQVNARLRKLRAQGMVGRIQGSSEFFSGDEREINVPWLWYCRPVKKVIEVAPDAVMWADKGRSTVDHDRDLTRIHRAIKPFIFEWVQRQDSDIRVTVEIGGGKTAFYPDARFTTGNATYYVEYQRANPTSSNGKNSTDVKMELYNALLKDRRNEKVIFVFPEPKGVEKFLNRVQDDYPFKWCLATSITVLLEHAGGKVFYTPHDEKMYDLNGDSI